VKHTSHITSQFWDPPNILFNEYWGSFPWGKASEATFYHSRSFSAEVENE